MDVLIIEPDHILAREIKRAFITAGFKVQISTGAQEAIGTIDKKIPDAIVLELQLASHSGVEFLHEFRSYEDWASIPIFIYSRVPEYALGADQKTWNSYGVARYFYKPKTTFNQLIGAIKGHLANESPA
jgi:DNA-binding response OmpR family regulator